VSEQGWIEGVPMASNSHSNISTYPAVTRQAAALVDGISTQVTSMLFADKILVTIIQEGRLAQWVKLY
jgi:proteasome assembly chaperone 3